MLYEVITPTGTVTVSDVSVPDTIVPLSPPVNTTSVTRSRSVPVMVILVFALAEVGVKELNTGSIIVT